ncbi:hypothetical protein [Companilactobacillus kimchii]|uniref:Integral membrane protein n=2 Tax=Companilactobacillus kimchii TaxID=2801452 RepID=A0ABR5NW03_9LACO|nr:hypothetical protein [Companilactobacillus kimchii]KAE9558078.1 hypothetical protein ATN91_14945 [Companilactobacillus kimchii]KRK52890.1 hypothetical protein FC97_GL002058 [Companilactobacillus kimchii DSM 13961 = JCM 10707]OWF33018.1 hypothetical protein LKACC12383_01508 [Companilactobacillus kimchii]GEO46979.1 hypothetical protein LKI01_09780 [Companilactobacillus paralimentarius]
MTKSDEVQELISSNNDLRKKLNPANEKYYSKLLIYVRTAGLFYDDYEVESKLLEILQDILDAQNDGSNAEDYFGQAPTDTANQLTASFTKTSLHDRLKFFGGLFGITAIWTLVIQLNGQEKQLNLVPFILNGVFMICLIFAAFWLIHQTIYAKIFEHKAVSFASAWIVSLLTVLIFTVIQFTKPTMLNIPITNNLIIIINSLIIIGSLAALFLIKAKWRPVMIAAEPMIWVIALSNIFKVYAPASMNKTILVTTAILSILSIIWFFGYFQWNNRKHQ